MEPKSAGGGALVGAILGAAIFAAAAQKTDLKEQVDANNIELAGGRISITTDGGCEAQAASRYRPRPGDLNASPREVGEYAIDSARCETLKTMFACAAARDYGISACTP